MATSTTITGLTALGGAPAANDVLVMVDISDPTQDPTGTTKEMTVANLFTAPTMTTVTVSSGGIAVTGNSTITGTLGVTSTVTVNGSQVSIGATGAAGAVRVTDDGGTSRWLAGILGGAGARDYSIFDLAGGGARITVDGTSGKVSLGAGVDLTGACPVAVASHVALGGSVRTTIGANGAATALTALPLGYFDINVGGTIAQVPYYNRGA